MRISDEQVKKILEGTPLVGQILEVGQEADQRDADRPLAKRVTKDVIAMPDREDMIAEIKARIESGEYQPSSDDIADAMIRRNIADRFR